jgi:hypothetical protein
MNQAMRSIRIGSYDVSIIVFVVLGVLLGTAVGATYMWATRTVNVSVEESLTVTNFPSTFHTHPGQNQTLDITIENIASVTYTVTLAFTLNDTTYQTQYVTCSSNTYTIGPGTNQITAWMIIDQQAPPANVQLTVQFHRE